MKRSYAQYLAPSVVLATMAVPNLASAQDIERSPYDPALYLMANVQNGTQRDVYLAKLTDAFDRLDTDQNGLDWDDFDRRSERLKQAFIARRAMRLADAARQHAEMDLDKDNRVSLAEMQQAADDRRSGKARMERKFAQADADGNGLITVGELGTRATEQDKRTLETLDTNHDGAVSIDEFSVIWRQQDRPSKSIEPKFNRFDDDGDGLLTVEDLGNIGPMPTRQRAWWDQERDAFARTLALDPNPTSSLTRDELSSIFLEQFAVIDTNGDAAISSEEIANTDAINRARVIAKSRYCSAPKPETGTSVVAYSTYDGDALSTISVDGQDQTTTVFDIAIQSGTTPLYVVLHARQPVIWQISGATERVEKLVLFGRLRRDIDAAATASSGMPADKIVFGTPDCLRAPTSAAIGKLNWTEANSLAFEASTGLRLSTPLSDSRSRSDTSPLIIGEPSNTVSQEVPNGFNEELWREGIRFWKNGIRDIPLSDVVSDGPAEPYEILPAEMGLAQLGDAGIIVPTKFHRDYKIVKPMRRFPAGMAGSHSVDLVLTDGLELPGGDLVHSCVFAESGERLVGRSHCKRKMFEPLPRVERKQPTVSIATAPLRIPNEQPQAAIREASWLPIELIPNDPRLGW